MQRKSKYKIITFAMLLGLVPTLNLGTIPQVFSGGHVTQDSLGKMLSPQKVGATTLDSNKMVQSVTPMSDSFNAVSFPQPSRPALDMRMPTEALSGRDFGYQESIAGLKNISAGQIAVVKGGETVFNVSGVSDANVQAALSFIYSNGSRTDDFVLFIGGNVTLSNSVADTGKSGTFSGLYGKSNSLTIVANTTDSLTSTPNVAAPGNYTIETPDETYFGTATVLRNITISANNDEFFALDNALALMPGVNFTGNVSIFAGSLDGTSNTPGHNVGVGHTNIYVESTGTGTMSLYGGNKNGGTILGSTHISIKDAGDLDTVTGGNASGGTISGTVNLSVTGFSGDIDHIYGAGIGTEEDPVTVTGNVYNNWNSTNPKARYNGAYYGGAEYGSVKGTIYNTFKGVGSFNGEKDFNGGVENGTVGVPGNTGTAIVNEFDTSKFTDGYANFAGIAGASNGSGNNNNPITVYGNIINYVKTGYGTSGASYMGGAAGAYGADYSNKNDMPDSDKENDANPVSVAQEAEKASIIKLYGNAYIWLQSGLVGDGQDYNIVLGAGYGFIKGDSVLEVGDGSTAPGGNTVGENGVSDGSRSSSNRTGVGGEGFVVIGDHGDGNRAATNAANGVTYNGNDTNLANSYWLNDIVGGGGFVGSNGANYWQVGDTYLIQNNSAARWTYGSGWEGNIVGNSYNFNNGAITDTLEGGFYGSQGNVYGNTNAQFNNGQTDWFLSGGAWNGRYISGNMTTVINNGVIPANTGGNYALNGNNVSMGNSSVYIYGGDFSNQPRQDGPKTVCGGNFNSGNSFVYGDSSLVLDLTGPNGNTFEFPAGDTYLSAGPGYNKSGVTSGTDANNTINLTIKANPDTATKLESATIYGDGSNSDNVKAGTINMTINADGATVGNVYASKRPLVSSTGLSRNVITQIGEGTTIAGNVYNTAESDDLTSSAANAGPNVSTVQFGDGSASTEDPIVVEGKVANFSSAKVSAGVNTTVAGGVLNGKNATAANHAATYSKSGDLTLEDSSTLAVSSTRSVISGGKLIVGSDVELSSPYINTSGLMNFSDLVMDKDGGRLSWIPTGTVISPTTTYNGAYWGSQKGYPVLTFNGGDASTGSGAFNITPDDFQGIDSKNNYAFLGDYTMSSLSTPSNPTWIGYVVPGQIRVFNTTSMNGSKGNWQYDLPGVTLGTPKPGTAMKAWASVAPNTPTPSFELKYVNDYHPEFAGQPFSYQSVTPAYIKSRSASQYNGDVLNAYPTTNPNFDVSEGTTGAQRAFSTKDYFLGNQLDGTNNPANQGSYIINNVVVDNTTSLSADNYILSSNDAASMTREQLEQLVDLKGVGVMSDITLSDGAIDEINLAGKTVQDPISVATNTEGKSYSVVEMMWAFGKSKGHYSNVVVLPQSAVISKDHQTAVNAFDASMAGEDANALKNQADLDTNWTFALGFNSDGTTHQPTITSPTDLVNKLQNLTSEDPILDENGDIKPVTYSYGGVLKNVTINVSFGSISLTTPEVYDFGTLSVSPKPLVAWANDSGSNVIVEDTRRGAGLKPWYVTVAQTQDLQGVTNGNNLAPYLIFKDGTGSQQITSAAMQIYAKPTPTTGTFNLNENWNSATGQGIHLNIPVQSQEKGTYQGQLTWALNDVPLN